MKQRFKVKTSKSLLNYKRKKYVLNNSNGVSFVNVEFLFSKFPMVNV